MGRSQLSEMRAVRKENERLKQILTELQLDNLILKESLDYLKAEGLMFDGLRQAVIHTVKSCTH